jgi:hypothetical protein
LTVAPEAHFIGTDEELAGETNEAASIKEGKCAGSEAQPEAAPGNLCLFASLDVNATELDLFSPTYFSHTGRTGTVFVDQAEAEGLVSATGDWVVTAK